MWIINFFPSWFATLLWTAGVGLMIAGVFLKSIPLVKNYNLPVKLGGAALFVVGIFLAGVYANEQKWLDRVKELEAKVKVAEEKSAATNVEIQDRVVTKTKIVKEKGDEVIKYVDNVIVKKEEIIKYIERCPVPKDIVDAHNAAAVLNKSAESVKK